MSDNKQIVRQLDILRTLLAQTYGVPYYDNLLTLAAERIAHALAEECRQKPGGVSVGF